MEVCKIKSLLNTLISDDLSLKEIIHRVDLVGTDQGDNGILLGEEGLLKSLTEEAATSVESTRNLLVILARAIDELYGKSQQDQFGKELTNYTEQFYLAEGLYKKAVASAILRIRNIDRSKLFRKSAQKSTDNNLIRNRLKKSYFDESIEKSNKLVTDMRQLASEFSQQVDLSKRTLDVLHEDSTTLTQTHGVFQEMDTNINTATRLVGKYNRREIWDKVIIAIAFLFFLLVIAYIVIKRLGRLFR